MKKIPKTTSEIAAALEHLDEEDSRRLAQLLKSVKEAPPTALETLRAYDAPRTILNFQNDLSFIRILVGPVGSGKTTACVLELLRRACRQKVNQNTQARSTRFVVIRNSYRQLHDTTRQTFEQWIPAHLGHWEESSFSFIFDFVKEDDHTRVRSQILFRSLDRPEDVKKLLSLDLTGAYINEVREIPKQVFDMLQSRVGRYPNKVLDKPTWYGIWGDSNPWHVSHYLHTLYLNPPGGHAFHIQPGGRSPHAENVANLPPGYYDRLVLGKDAQWVSTYVDGQFASSLDGSVYGALLSGVTTHPVTPTGPVFAAFDLGFGDGCGVWFWQFVGGKIQLLKYLENHNKPLSFYFNEIEGLQKDGWAIDSIYLPHDSMQKKLETGISTYAQFSDRFPETTFEVVPSIGVKEGIAAGRWLLEQKPIFGTDCSAGIEHLRGYHFKFDEASSTFSDRPVHDEDSECADAWRYAAIAVKESLFVPTPLVGHDAVQTEYAAKIQQVVDFDRRKQFEEDE